MCYIPRSNTTSPPPPPTPLLRPLLSLIFAFVTGHFHQALTRTNTEIPEQRVDARLAFFSCCWGEGARAWESFHPLVWLASPLSWSCLTAALVPWDENRIWANKTKALVLQTVFLRVLELIYLRSNWMECLVLNLTLLSLLTWFDAACWPRLCQQGWRSGWKSGFPYRVVPMLSVFGWAFWKADPLSWVNDPYREGGCVLCGVTALLLSFGKEKMRIFPS